MQPPRFPSLFTIGKSGQLDRMDPREYDSDPRGLVFCSEPPDPRYTYVMGVDPSLGRTGWARHLRVEDDLRTNNGAIEIIKMGRDLYSSTGDPIRTPDIQVCEFAAPVDAFELGYIANLLGRLYAGADEDQCQCILEVKPGPGGMTLRQMIDCGYGNFWCWQYYGERVPETTSSVGWVATQNSVRDLWVKSSRHWILKRCQAWSPFLIEEYADARMNDQKGYAESPNNEKGHGDRMRAFNLALWAGNKWDTDIERTAELVTTQKVPVNWAATDMTMEQIHAAWAESVDQLWE